MATTIKTLAKHRRNSFIISYRSDPSLRRESQLLASLGDLAGSRDHFVQLAARLGIRLHLAIPIVVRPGMKQCLQLATLLRRELFNRPLDLSNCAYGTKLGIMHYGVNLMPAGAERDEPAAWFVWMVDRKGTGEEAPFAVQ
jgi:hypothetical protein